MSLLHTGCCCASCSRRSAQRGPAGEHHCGHCDRRHRVHSAAGGRAHELDALLTPRAPLLAHQAPAGRRPQDYPAAHGTGACFRMSMQHTSRSANHCHARVKRGFIRFGPAQQRESRCLLLRTTHQLLACCRCVSYPPAHQDIQDSTCLWEKLPGDVMNRTLQIHDRMMRDVGAQHGGYECGTGACVCACVRVGCRHYVGSTLVAGDGCSWQLRYVRGHGHGLAK